MGVTTLDAFVSYAARDRRETRVLCEKLTALGIRLWLDTEVLRWHRASWREAVHAGIASSRAVLIILTTDWVNSPACRYELAIAVERRVPAVAVTLSGESRVRVPTPPLLPHDVEVVDSDGGLERAVSLRLARRSTE
jgi:hypothetical protein